ncbi:MAG TPA: cation diffusion facilitator family transporter [Solimonas sp.]|nr:cation diffusion facilitator family transporter [Solimonas sp.]
MSAGADSLKSVLYALGANFGIALAKTVAALITQSSSMLAEAIHSFADCGNQGLLLWGMRSARQGPSPDFPMGHGKALYFWSFVVAILLFSMGGLFSVYEGWHKLHAPEPVKSPWIAIGVLVLSIGLEAVSMRACMGAVNKVRGGRGLLQWFKESRQSELVVIFAEDLAALCGLVLALVFIVLAMVTGNPVFDAIGTLCIGALLVIVAALVAIEIKAMLVGQSAEAPIRAGIEAYLRGAPGVAAVLNVITLHFGDDLMVAVKARMSESRSCGQLAGAINAVEAGLKQRYPQVKWIFFEPDVVD